MTDVLYCASCGRCTHPGHEQIEPVPYIGIEWCPHCAAVTTLEGSRFVNQPSPGRLYPTPPEASLDAWLDCYDFRPKKRILVKLAKRELQREWDSWVTSDRSDAKMHEFYWWAYRHRPYFLTFRCKHDRWQRVHSWLIEFEGARSAV